MKPNFHLFHTLHSSINSGELPGPPGIVEEWSVIKPVIIWTVDLSMVTWCQGGHLMSVDGVVPTTTTSTKVSGTAKA